MKIILWIVLLFISAPIAIAVLFLYPIVWILLIPFRIVGIAVDSILDLLAAVLKLPAKILRGL